jgi:hypothetical protein
VASALSAEKHALKRASVSTKIGEVVMQRRDTFVKHPELNDARKRVRCAIARYPGAKRCTGGKCEGQVLIGYKVGETGDVEERLMQVGVRLGRFVRIIGRRGVLICHDSRRLNGKRDEELGAKRR